LSDIHKKSKEFLNEIFSKLKDVKEGIKCFKDNKLHNHELQLKLNVAMIQCICGRPDNETFKYLIQCMNSTESSIRDKAEKYHKQYLQVNSNKKNLIILANSFPIDEKGDQPIQQTCEDQFQNDLIKELKQTKKSTYVQFEVMNESFFKDLNEMSKKINILVI